MKKLFSYTLSKLFGIIAGFFSITFLSRTLGVESYGEYSYLINTASMSSAVLYSWTIISLGHLYYRGTQLRYSNIDSFFLKIITCIFLGALSFGVFIFLLKGDLTYLIIACLSFGMAIFDFNNKLNNLKEDATKVLCNNIVKSLSFIILIALFIKKSSSLELALGVIVFSYLISVNPIFNLKKIANREKMDLSLIKESLTYSFPIVLSSLCLIFINFFDRHYLKKNISLKALGIYSVNYDLVQFGIGSLILIISLYTGPLLTKGIVLNCENDIAKSLRRINLLFSLFLIPLALFFMIMLGDIVKIVSGPDFVISNRLFSIFIGLALIFSSVRICYLEPFFIYGKKRQLQVVSIIVGIVFFIMSLIFLVPKFEIVGASISIFLCFFTSFTVLLYFISPSDRNKLNIDILWKELVGYQSLICVLVIILIDLGVLSSLVGGGLFILFYLLCFLVKSKKIIYYINQDFK